VILALRDQLQHVQDPLVALIGRRILQHRGRLAVLRDDERAVQRGARLRAVARHERSRATSIDDADVRQRHVAIPQVEDAYRPMGLPSAFGR
jgi:hypothetical protein